MSDRTSVLGSDEGRCRFVAYRERADAPPRRSIDGRGDEKPPSCRNTPSPAIGSRLTRRYSAATTAFTLATGVSSFPLKSMHSALLPSRDESNENADTCDCVDLAAGELACWECYRSGIKEVPE